jgi:hypothetical protein
MKKLVSLDKIVVHPGRSHADEILAVMLAEASTHDGNIVPVYRRNPSEDDLQDNRTLVMDVGGKIDDWAMVFDHHQLDRNAEPECAFSLISKEIGAADSLEAFFDWFATWRKIDSKGPFTWAKDAGVDWSKVSGLLSPVSELVHDWFEEAHDDVPVDEVLVRRLQLQGKKILDAAAEFRTFSEMADAKGLPAEVAGVKVFDLREFTAQTSQRFGMAYAKAKGATDGVIVSQDDRGPGYAYLRINDDPKIDFSQCVSKPYCAFAHANGFILKTKDRNVANVEVIVDAKV